VVNNIARSKFPKCNETRSRDIFTSITDRDKCSDGEAGEIIAGQKPFSCKVSVRIKFRLSVRLSVV
jgi:hypothetical protein